MNILKLILVTISFLLLAAHFYRAGLIPIVVLCLILPLLLFIKQRWVARLLQTFLVIGSLEWVRTLLTLAQHRQAFGQPWARLVIILGMVALITALSALIFQSRSLKQRYR